MNRKNPEEVLELFRKIEDFLVIVEGKKDVRALNTLGITNILPISGRPLIAIVEKVAGLRDSQRSQKSQRSSTRGAKVAQGVHAVPGGDRLARKSDIIILTDFDREGRHIAAKLDRLLRAHRVHPNQRLRSRIMNLGFNRIEDITMDSVTRIGERRHQECLQRSACGRRSLPIEREGDDYVKASSNINEVRDKGDDKGEWRSREAGHHRRGVRPD